MPETISVHLQAMSGVATLKMYLRTQDIGDLVNPGGDILDESPVGSSRFIMTLTESRVGLGSLAVGVYDGDELPENVIWSGWLSESSNLAIDTFPSAGGGGDSVWTEAEKDYVIQQVGLLSYSGSSVVVTSGFHMCGRGDVEQIFGKIAVATWGDLNNNGDEAEIESRINYRIAMADNYIRSTLGNGPWVMPVEGEIIPVILAVNCAALAGVYLYEGRGVQDYNPAGHAQHQLSFHKTNVENFIKGVLVGTVNLSPLAYNISSAAPETVSNDIVTGILLWP